MNSSTSTSSCPEITHDDEVVIQRRLIYDGSMEESYINLLQKLIIKWVLTDYKSAKECDTMYNNILIQLSRVYTFRKKSEITRQRISKDSNFFCTLGRTMDDHVISITDTITSTEKLLKDARNERERTAEVKKVVVEVASYSSVKDLMLNKKRQEKQLLEMTQTFERISKLQQKLYNQVENMTKELKSCTDEIEKNN